VTISVSNIYTPLNLNAETKDIDKKIKGKRGPKKSEAKEAPASKRGTKRARAKDEDDDEFTCSYVEEDSHSTSSGSERLDKSKPKKRAKFNSSTLDALEFTDIHTYDSMEGTESMTATPLRRDSCSEDTLNEILASTCGTPIDEQSSWNQLECNASSFTNPMEEETFPAPAAPLETNQVPMSLNCSGGHGEQFYFGEMTTTTVSFIDEPFDSNIFSY